MKKIIKYLGTVNAYKKVQVAAVKQKFSTKGDTKC